MRISDWSSDVCSSDLVGFVRRGQAKKLIESFLEGNRDGSLEKLRISTARYDQQCQQVPQQHGQQDRPGLSSNKRAISSVGSHPCNQHSGNHTQQRHNASAYKLQQHPQETANATSREEVGQYLESTGERAK